MPDNLEQDQQWSSGNSSLPRENGKWEAWGRAVLSFILGVVSTAFFAGSKSRNIDELLVWKGEANTRFDNIDKEFKRLDRDGTNRSHWVDEQQSVQIASNVSAISDIRAKAEQRGEVIAAMQYKLERLEGEKNKPTPH